MGYYSNNRGNFGEVSKSINTLDKDEDKTFISENYLSHKIYKSKTFFKKYNCKQTNENIYSHLNLFTKNKLLPFITEENNLVYWNKIEPRIRLLICLLNDFPTIYNFENSEDVVYLPFNDDILIKEVSSKYLDEKLYKLYSFREMKTKTTEGLFVYKICMTFPTDTGTWYSKFNQLLEINEKEKDIFYYHFFNDFFYSVLKPLDFNYEKHQYLDANVNNSYNMYAAFSNYNSKTTEFIKSSMPSIFDVVTFCEGILGFDVFNNKVYNNDFKINPIEESKGFFALFFDTKSGNTIDSHFLNNFFETFVKAQKYVICDIASNMGNGGAPNFTSESFMVNFTKLSNSFSPFQLEKLAKNTLILTKYYIKKYIEILSIDEKYIKKLVVQYGEKFIKNENLNVNLCHTQDNYATTYLESMALCQNTLECLHKSALINKYEVSLRWDNSFGILDKTFGLVASQFGVLGKGVSQFVTLGMNELKKMYLEDKNENYSLTNNNFKNNLKRELRLFINDLKEFKNLNPTDYENKKQTPNFMRETILSKLGLNDYFEPNDSDQIKRAKERGIKDEDIKYIFQM